MKKFCPGMLILVLGCGWTGCGGSGRGPLPAPTSLPSPTVGTLVNGTVSDSAHRPLVDARVEVLDGPQAGTSATTNSRGEFSLRGAFDDATRFRATMNGHKEATATRGPACEACNPNWWIHFALDPLAPPLNIAGRYILAFEADGACEALIPAEARGRTYTADIAPVTVAGRPSDTSFEVTVGGASLLEGYSRFPINVAVNYLSAWLGDLHGDPGLLERVAENTYVSFGGESRAVVTDTKVLSMTFDGTFEYCARKLPMGPSYSCSPAESVAQAQCASRSHRLILTAR
jgi:hypothetical protein